MTATELMAKKEKSWLQSRLTAMNALYRKFGRDGLKDEKLSEMSLLLTSIEMEFRDMAKGQSEMEKLAARALELEICVAT